ncbi:Nuclear transport factor 2 [Artemisia annua]|uniref:Nuclear transport factor 2 n=1 Tax=Artemisia annua TaxID=35608 RepID=A0A2U1NXI8_ARTAN|nr:Nuclear transport factor 2 [Artemisia annua]
MHKFYKEESTLAIPVEDGSIRSVTTIKFNQEIRKGILESDIINRDIIRPNVHAQDSIANSVVIGVVGVLRKDSTVKRFSQTFLLAPQPKGFYVHTDFFQFLITNDDTEDNPVLMKDQGTSTEDEITVDSSNNMSSLITKACSFSISKATVEVSQKTNGKSSAPAKNEKYIATEAACEILEKDKSSKSSSIDKIIDVRKGQDEKNLSSDPQDEVEKKISYATNLAKPSLPTETGSSSTASGKSSAVSKNIDKTIYVRNLPRNVTRRTLTSAVKKYGTIKHKNIHIRTIGDDGHRYAFMEFNNQKAAKQAVKFDGYECEVEYKKCDIQDQEDHDRSIGSTCGSVGDNKSGDNNGNGNGSKVVV